MQIYSPVVKILVTITLLLLSAAKAYSEVIIFTSDNPTALAVAEKIQRGIKTKSRITTSDKNVSSSDIAIALGSEQFSAIQKKHPSALIGAFINYSDTIDQRSAGQSTYIFYSDPSPQLVANFFDRNFADTKIGFIYDSRDLKYIEKIRSSLNNKTVKIVAEQYSGNVFNDLKRLASKNIDVMFIGRNKSIYRSDNIRFVLDALFRKKIPAVSTSKILLIPGALVSVSPVEEVAIESICSLANKLVSKTVNEQHHYFIEKIQIDINHSLTKFFSLTIEDVSK